MTDTREQPPWEKVRAFLVAERRQAARRLNELSDLLELPRYRQVEEEKDRHERRS